MTTKPIDRAEMEELERVLATYGADRDRWPAAARLRLAPLLSGSVPARDMLQQALALDRLLDLAPSVSSVRQRALAAHIVSEAARAPRRSEAASSDARRAVVVEFDRSPEAVRRALPAGVRPGSPWRGRTMPAAAALLAASLLLGIFADWSMQLGGLLSDAATGFEISSASDTGASSALQHLGLGDEAADTGEEDFL